MSLHGGADEEALELHEVLGQTFRLLDEVGDEHTARLVCDAVERLRLEWNGGWYHPYEGDNWTSQTHDAVLEVDPLPSASSPTTCGGACGGNCRWCSGTMAART